MHKIRRHTLFIVIMAMAMLMAAAACVCAVSVKNAVGYVNASDGLNVRKSAKTSADIVTTLENDTKLTIKAVVFKSKTSTKASKKWYKISVDGKTGYVRADYVDGLKYNTVEAKVTSAVNYRKGAGTEMTNVGSLKKGSKVKVYLKATPVSSTAGSSKTWYMIKVNGKKYYACSKYFKLIESTSATDEANKAETEANKKAEEEAAAKITVTVSNLTYPNENTPITEGRAFSLAGKITASDKISNLDIGITDEDGNWVIRVPKQPNSTTFDISTVDNDIKFGMLNAGTYYYVAKVKVNDITKEAFSHKFAVVNTVQKTLTDSIIKSRINELVSALKGKYFTVDLEPASGAVDEACNVENVIKQNSVVLELLRTNKGGENLDAALMPSHYNPGGIAQQKGYSCCGFANFAGWYIAADTITDDVSFKPIKVDVTYDYDNMSKYAKVGDILRSTSHSYMVISVDSDGCTVLDCNWDHQSVVKKHTITYGYYSSVTINRAINRAE